MSFLVRDGSASWEARLLTPGTKTGRRPDRTKTYNFINHFRQAECTPVDSHVSFEGKIIQTKVVPSNMGASGQCCTFCTLDEQCQVRWPPTTSNITVTLSRLGHIPLQVVRYSLAQWGGMLTAVLSLVARAASTRPNGPPTRRIFVDTAISPKVGAKTHACLVSSCMLHTI